MAMWDNCAICGRAIPIGEPCYGVKNWRGDPIGGDTICRDCLVLENVPTLTPPNEPLTLGQLREMDGKPVWVEDVKHWALIDIEKGGQWDGVPFAIWAENGMKFTYNIKNRGLHCYRRPPEGEEDNHGT